LKRTATLRLASVAAGATILFIAQAAGQLVASAGDHSPHQVRRLRLPDATLEYLDFGGPKAASVLLFLPGYGNSAHIYDDIAPRFTDRFRVLALTPRGQGGSSTPDSGYTIETFANDVRTMLDSLGERGAVLVGHSVAGATITRFAARWPERTTALVYLDATMDFAKRDSVLAANPVLRPPPTDSSPTGWHRWYADVFYGFWSNALQNDISSYSTDSSAQNRPRLLPALLMDATSYPKEYRLTKSPILAVIAVKTLDANYPWLRTSHDSAARRQAQLYLDRVLNPWYLAGARRLQLERSDAQVISIPGHHFIFITAQQRVAEAVLQFLGHVPH
jgi:pimeloyl-ACP methyl ester carboxylesterase